MFEKCQYTQTEGLFPPYCVDFPCNTQSIAASNRLVWRKNPSPSGTFPIFKQGLGHISPPGKFLFFRDMSRTASFFLGAQKETKETPGGREYGRISAHPERLLGGSLVTFWPSRKSLAPQGETPLRQRKLFYHRPLIRPLRGRLSLSPLSLCDISP